MTTPSDDIRARPTGWEIATFRALVMAAYALSAQLIPLVRSPIIVARFQTFRWVPHLIFMEWFVLARGFGGAAR